MLTYDLECRDGLSRYDYLYRCVKEDILSGRLKPGEKLPSKRSLARHLQVSVVTVESAYAQLAGGGLYLLRGEAGLLCGGGGAQPRGRAPRPTRQGELGRGASPAAGSEAGWERDRGLPLFSVGPPDAPGFDGGGEKLLRAVPHSGVPELRRAISRYLYRFRGIEAAPEQIVVGAGAEYLYNLVVQMLGRELTYGVEDPGYSKASRIYRLSGAACAFLPMDDQGVSPRSAEEAGVQVLHLSPNHQFPAGTVVPISRRQALLRWAGEGETRYIIEDDYDSEFRFTGRPIPAMQTIDSAGRVLYVNTFSRSLAPSLRIGYLVLPQGLIDRYRDRLGFYSCTVPALEQYTLARFLEEGRFEAHINRMRVFYRGRRDQVIRAVEESSLAGRCRVLRQDAGLHFLLELDTQQEDRILAGRAEERGLRLSFLSDYQHGPGRASPHTLVVRYPGVELEQLGQALELLAGLL